MNEETKKLITPEMLSDVYGGIVTWCQVIGTVHPFIHFGIVNEDTKDVREKDISIYELKDKLEEWIIDNKPEDRDYGLYYDGAWSAEIEEDPVYSLYSAIGCKTKLEALVKLYHAMKAEK